MNILQKKKEEKKIECNFCRQRWNEVLMLLYCWRHEGGIMFNSVSVHEPHRLNPLKWPAAVLGSSVFGLHPLVNMHNYMNKYASNGIQQPGEQHQNIIRFTAATFSHGLFYDISMEKAVSEQYLLVMKSFFMQNKLQTLMQPHLALQTNPVCHINQPFLQPLNWLTRSNLQTIQYCGRLDLAHNSKGLFIFQMSYPACTNDVAAWHQVLNKLWTGAIHSTLWLHCNVYSTIKIVFSIRCRWTISRDIRVLI